MLPGMIYDPRLLTWRQQFNPLVGLTIRRVVQMLSNSEMGYKAEIQWLYLFLERRDAVLRAVKQRRIGSMKTLGHTIKIKAGKEGKEAETQQQYLTEVYDRIDNIRQAVEFMSTATFRGYAHLEKHYDEDDNVIHLEPVPQYLWCHKLPSKDWLYNAKAFQTATGIPIDVGDFVIREDVDPVDEIAVINFVRKGMSQKDWDAFVETYGIPPLFIIMPPGVGAGLSPGGPPGVPGSDILSHYQSLAEKVISDSRGVLPNGAQVVNPTNEIKGSSPFAEHIRYQDEQIVLAATSGLLTSLSSPTGMNNDQGQAHQETFNILAKAEAGEISEVFQKQIDKAELAKEFGDGEVLVYFDLESLDVEEDNPIDDAQKLASAGYMIDPEELAEETGYKITLKPQPGMGGAGGFGGGAGAEGSYDTTPYDGSDKYSDWVGNRVKGLTDKIMNALNAGDAEILDRLVEIEEELENSSK